MNGDPALPALDNVGDSVVALHFISPIRAELLETPSLYHS